MSELAKQILSGNIPTPPMSSQLAREGWYEVPVTAATRADINRGREALARLVSRSSAMPNVPVWEADGLAGKHGPEVQAVWLALNKAIVVATDTHEDSSFMEWQRKGCPMS